MQITRPWAAALLTLAMAVALPTLAQTKPAKVLLVVSSEGRDAGKTRPGFEMDEYAQAYQVLRANGLAVEVASPTGGAVQADKYNDKADHIQALDAEAHARLLATRRTQDIAPGEHQAIFVLGGKGAMFDLPKDGALQQLLARHFEGGGVLAAVCHGPAVFAAVRLGNGQPLVAGRRVTGFSDEEEAVFGKRWAREFPFLLETRLREQGAVWEEAALMMPKLVVDGRLITGQNPFSTTLAAEAVVRALGRTPVAREVHLEERSMHLVQRWLAGEHTAVRRLLRTNAADYKTDLIAMLGYYQFTGSTQAAQRLQALHIMELAAPHMSHPQFQTALAQAQAEFGAAPTEMTLPLHVLVVEDHAPLRAQIVALLQGAGHRVDEASDGRLALQLALETPPDVMLLDLGLPGMGGLVVCERLRALSPRHVPVLMLTAHDTLPDKLGGFAAGADDYLVKPFASEELLARVWALARRGGAGHDYLLRVGSLHIDRRAQEATRDGQRLVLPPTAFAILLMLAEASPRALSRSDIVRRLWDDDPPESDPLRTHLYQLRQQLDRPFAHAMLKTVHGVGFRLDADDSG